MDEVVAQPVAEATTLTVFPFELEPQCIANALANVLTAFGVQTHNAKFGPTPGTESFFSHDGRVRVLKQYRVKHDDCIYRLDVAR